MLKKNRASLRHWIWLGASLKFLVPFSLLIGLGTYFDFGWSAAAPGNTSAKSSALVTWSQPLVQPVASAMGRPRYSAEPSSTSFVTASYTVFAVWAIGLLIVLFCRFGRGRRLRKLVNASRLLKEGREHEALRRVQSRSHGSGQVCLASSKSTIEPGVHGILDPVLLLPAGIADRLTDRQLEAVLAHELVHILRRDNLTATTQVVVETIFWFHPLVWWIGTRMVEERERACDEAVLQSQTDPQVYAGAILTVCDFYLSSPSTRAPGIMGSNLQQRIEAIMLNKGTAKLNLARRLLLVTAVIAIVSLPIVFGSTQNHVSAFPTGLKFEVASIRLNPDQSVPEGMPPPAPVEGMGGGPKEGIDPDQGPPVIRIFAGGRLVATRATLRGIIRDAYPSRPDWRLEPWRITGGPDWIRSEKYNIEAKSPNATPEQMMPMLQALLAERFKLRFHWETRELPVYELTAANGGLRLEDWKEGSCVSYDAGRNAGSPSGMPPPPAPPPPPPPAGGAGASPAWGRQPNQPCGIYTMGSIPPEMYAMKATMSEFVPVLEYILKRTVVDKTSFRRTFNLHLVYEDFAPGATDSPPPSPRAGLPFETALQQQGGLKLESRRGPVSVLVVDSVERPSEN